MRQPDDSDDPLTALLRAGARRLLEQAIAAEGETVLATRKDLKLADGRDRGVRHGHGPERTIQTGLGPVAVRRAKVRDRGAAAAGERCRFTSAIRPRWARRPNSLDALLPIGDLRGVSTGDVPEALAALPGQDAPNRSPAVIGRLKADGAADDARWQPRDRSARRSVSVGADGVSVQARLEPAAERLLVIRGATPEGKTDRVGFRVGVRESAPSWRELLADLMW